MQGPSTQPMLCDANTGPSEGQLASHHGLSGSSPQPCCAYVPGWHPAQSSGEPAARNVPFPHTAQALEPMERATQPSGQACEGDKSRHVWAP